jgi:hypothetical protein
MPDEFQSNRRVLPGPVVPHLLISAHLPAWQFFAIAAPT